MFKNVISTIKSEQCSVKVKNLKAYVRLSGVVRESLFEEVNTEGEERTSLLQRESCLGWGAGRGIISSRKKHDGECIYTCLIYLGGWQAMGVLLQSLKNSEIK